jgi:probable phosphoglycerate mutase
MRLYLIRHGQSEGNLGKSIPDPDLTDLGKEQARLTGRRLAAEDIEILLSSPLKRSIHTARIIGEEIGVVPQLLAEVMESWNGSELRSPAEIAAQYPDLDVDLPDRWWPDAEKEEDLYRRAREAEIRIREIGYERDIAVVSHGTFGAVLISTFLGAPPCGYTRFSQHNCCVSILVLQPGRAKLYKGNDVSHLPPESWT